jgi:hypothetical protein
LQLRFGVQKAPSWPGEGGHDTSAPPLLELENPPLLELVPETPLPEPELEMPPLEELVPETLPPLELELPAFPPDPPPDPPPDDVEPESRGGAPQHGPPAGPQLHCEP